MSKPELNYKHLHYFWTVAKEGGVARAAERLGVSPQTISGQLGKLERDIGRTLFTQVGRRLELTEAGREALRYADEIFLLGERLREALDEPALGQASRLTVGIADSVPKLVAYKLLAPVVEASPQLRLVCHEGEFDELTSALSRHKLDIVLSDRDLGQAQQRRLVARRLASCPIGIYAARSLLEKPGAARNIADFSHAPMLLPSKRTSMRTRLDVWMDAEGLTPNVVGEFDDSALLTTFGGNGAGYFPAATVLTEMLSRQYDAELVIELSDVNEGYYAISLPSRLPNLHVARLLQSALP
ncbi:LysR substrate-binding domain-containing protein [Chitinimonas sp. BJB300]|uniref:LysR substrate-binding domain-containing protein n=1 Tax=Chitinimonas sp. BJB300 TaxID=1559339 RepID=UPI000C104403|nr:LysR substrate-binding domain-containing protein [Chitinimonas sp. BJB300]PHV11203.1 LysR family transcriptional regulator [Chitinimonas sp. BJB300]TSJ89040.1 LysR family transcriptional regulator [Chitinimonas sp. BJB300]